MQAAEFTEFWVEQHNINSKFYETFLFVSGTV